LPEGLDIREEVPCRVVFQLGVGCGATGAALVEKDGTVDAGVKVGRVRLCCGAARAAVEE
jgi:hypothetical protein